ncbi:MAG: hypothetical protein HY898_08875 [Deltaproteobacteria bacterium]|nr:hypothetical protein [Deltaproteobacteria bacterium]
MWNIDDSFGIWVLTSITFALLAAAVSARSRINRRAKLTIRDILVGSASACLSAVAALGWIHACRRGQPYVPAVVSAILTAVAVPWFVPGKQRALAIIVLSLNSALLGFAYATIVHYPAYIGDASGIPPGQRLTVRRTWHTPFTGISLVVPESR